MFKRQKGQIQGFDTNLTIDEIIEQLNSREQPDVLNGLRNLTALLSHGVAVESALPHVIKLVVLPDLQIRRVVYTFLAHFSEECPAQALMAVNILQRALSDKNSLVRGLAMRALTSIRVREIAEVAKMSMEQHRADEAPFVRRIIAIGVGKLARFCPEFSSDLAELLSAFFDDGVAQVVGAAIQSFNSVCPEGYALIHPHFHKICGMMGEFDEFQQVEALQLLARYCRANFADCTRITDDEIPGDLAQACKAAALLLRVHYPSVVLEAASFLYHCSPAFARQYEIQGVCQSASHAVAVALVRQASNYLNMNPLAIFAAIKQIAETHPQLFAPFYKDFYVNTFDTSAVKFQKICILKHLARAVPDTEQDAVLNELRMYLQYSMSNVYEEQQELTQFVLQAIGNIVRRKAVEMLGKLDEFDEEYLSILRAPIKRAVRQGADYLFANDMILQQSVIEIGAVLAVLSTENRLQNMFVENAIGDVLLTAQQMYTDIRQDAAQDAKQVIPRAVWPSSLGFPQELDPLEYKDDTYTGKLNEKSLIQVTKVSIFIQQCIRDLIQVYPVMRQATQTPRCVSARTSLLYTFIQLRYVFAPFCAEFLRRALRTLTDEPAPVRTALCAFVQACSKDIEVFRAAPVYFQQRRILSDQKALAQNLSLIFNAYPQIVAENGQSVPDIQIMSPEVVAEEQANIGYCIEQMTEYVQQVCQLDVALDVRDFAVVMSYAAGNLVTNTGKPPVMQQVMGSLSNIVGAFDSTTRQLPLWAPVNTPDEVRTRRVDTKVARIGVQQADLSISTSPNTKEDTGIQIRSNVGVNDFLGQPKQNPAQPKEESSDYYYYSDEESNTPVQPQVAQPKPTAVRQVVRVNPVPVVQVPKAAAPKPVPVSQPKIVAPATVATPVSPPAAAVPASTAAAAHPAPPKPQEKNDDEDLLNMLFQ